MITLKEFPGTTFETKEQAFAALRNNVDKIISLKKAEQKSYLKNQEFNAFPFLTKSTGEAKGLKMQSGYIYPVINTTKYMDSHLDVHFDGLWNKSARDQDGKILYCMDHKTEVEKVIAWPSSVKILLKSIPWALVGKDYDGETEALIYEIDKSNIVNQKALEAIENNWPVQNSVRMMYIKIQLGMKSDLKEDVEYRKYYDRRIEEIANKDLVEQYGYFWGIEEAKIVIEGSMVVKGSNDATPILELEAAEKGTLYTEPDKSTQMKNIINPNLF